ncbi:hypothetical protein E3E23_08425 [Thermococcus sp. CX2]|uniref:hypothetical protein n=1 Tax=Thermococcus sp. CX2 TaxID=163006 RepID=UPI00143B7DE6|nr:hypothetical protein [Thermococcus sp. CX2]NJE85845.1 hypothetical protein [Thermococcus sp. CX2]
MLVRGKIAGNKASVPFTARKDKKGVEIKVDFPDEEFTYSVDCPCLEPLELLGLLLPSFEEKLGEIHGVFVEEVKEEKSHSLLNSLRRFLSKGG